LGEHGIKEMFVTIVQDLLLVKPANPYQAIVEKIKAEADKKNFKVSLPASGEKAPAPADGNDSDEDSEDEEDISDMQDFVPRKPAGRRVSVSASVMDTSKNKDFKYQVFEKSEAERDAVMELLDGSVLFTKLSIGQKSKIVDAFEKITVEPNSDLIKEGDQQADYFYAMVTGSAKATIGGNCVKEYSDGGCFGELALLYNAPRAASVTVTSDTCEVYRLDRITFKMTVVLGVEEARTKRLEFLKKVDLFAKNLSETQFMQLADVCIEQVYREGTDIITEGESGNEFFILENGEVEFSQGGVNVGTATDGMTFGELALINDAKRVATARAVKECKVHIVKKDTFGRVLGSMSSIMADKYSTESKV